MPLARLKQIAQEAAVAGQAPVWDAVAGIWVPARPGAGFAGLESQAITTTTSGTFVDGFAGGSISPPEDGDYIATFNSGITGTATNNIIDIAIGLNGTATAETGSLRRVSVGNGNGSSVSEKILTGLTTGDTVHGIYRRFSGAGSSGLVDRVIRLVRVTS